MEVITKIVGALVLAAILIFVVAAFMAIPVMLLVNYIFSEAAIIAVFGGPIEFWKAFWLNFLCGMLFKTTVNTGKNS